MNNRLSLFDWMTFALIFPAVSICKWRTVLKWYVRLRREMKIRMFTKIARRSIANIVNIPGRIGHSLDDECLDIATIRRNKYASLLNELSEKSSNKMDFSLRISKSLTTLITNDDSHDSNDTNNFSTNDLSVAEKSMRMLNITAEDVMDACARIQERSYWSAQDEIAKTPEAMEKETVQKGKDEAETDDASKIEPKDKEENIKKPTDILEKKDVARDSQIEKDERKDEREVNALRSKQTITDVEKAADYNLMEEVIIRSFQIEREGEDNKIDKKEQTLIDKDQDVLLIKSRDVTSDRIDNLVKSTESHKLQEASSRRRKREEEAERLAKICPLSSVQCKNARNMEVKPCTSLVRKLETKLRPISANQKEKWFDPLDRKTSYRLKLTSNGSDKKEYNSRTSLCSCHRALKRNTEKGKPARSTDINDKKMKHDRKEFKHFMSIINTQKDKMNGCGSTFRYSESYRLRKQIQKAARSSTKQTVAWGSMSLAQTARPSGYARDVVATNKSSEICQRNIQSEAYTESIDSRSIYNSSLTEKNYARSEKREAKGPEANDLTLLANKIEMKARRRQDLSPNRKLSNEEREAVELRALRAFNELTLLEDKKKLEARRNRDSSNYEQPTRESEVSATKVCKPHDDLTLPEEQQEIDTIREHDFSSRKRSMEDSSSLKISNEYTSEELKAEEKRDSSKYEMSEENIESSRNLSDHSSEVHFEGTGILSSETRQQQFGNANSSPRLNERYAGQAYTSLNLREITRNIEWTIRPRGIILTNKNLHRQFSEDERLRESHQRDIVDDNVASTLHSAFFFKPEIVTRVFRRAQTRISESLPSFPSFSTSWREDFNAEFVCQVNNETVMQGNRDSSFDLERIEDRTDLGNSSFPTDANGNRVGGEENRDLYIIFIDQQASHESETAIIENSTAVGSPRFSQEENARSNVENIEATNIFLMCILRDFGLEVSEESVHNVTERNTEEYGDISNVIANFQSSNETSPEEGDNNRNDTISSHQQILIPNDSCPDDDVTSPVNLLQHDNSYNLPDKTYTNAIDISSEKRTHENNSSLKDANNNAELQVSSCNNNQFDTLVNKCEKSVFNQTPENVSQLSSSGSRSFIKKDNFNQLMLRSIDEEEQGLTQLSDSEATLKSQKTDSIMNLETTNRDMMSQFEAVETLNSLETIQNGIKNEDKNRNIYETANIFSTRRFSGMSQNERLQQDDSFYSMYERNHDGTKTPISLGGGSLMEEFPNSTIPSEILLPETFNNESCIKNLFDITEG